MQEPLPIPGYRPQSELSLEMVRAMKVHEEIVLRLLDGLADMGDIDKRWLAIGRTSIEQGFMAVNRSIMRPTRVALPDDEG